MRPFRYSINVTLDRCCDHRTMVADEELHRHAAENIDRADALHFDRVTYEMMEAAFRSPARTGVRLNGVQADGKRFEVPESALTGSTPQSVTGALARLITVGGRREIIEMNRVQVVEYDSEWPGVFERIRSHVWPAVSDIALNVEHVGSTAVHGLSAKPVIDVCIVVAAREDVPACVERLAGIGYVHRGTLGVPDRDAFRRPDGLPRHHLYLSPRGSPSLKNHLGFRDYLRSHPEAVHEYGELKLSLARRFPADLDSYVVGKTEFIIRILAEIGLNQDELAEIRRISAMENAVRPSKPRKRYDQMMWIAL